MATEASYLFGHNRKLFFNLAITVNLPSVWPIQRYACFPSLSPPRGHINKPSLTHATMLKRHICPLVLRSILCLIVSLCLFFFFSFFCTFEQHDCIVGYVPCSARTSLPAPTSWSLIQMRQICVHLKRVLYRVALVPRSPHTLEV